MIRNLTLIGLLFSLSIPAFASEIAGVQFDDSINIQGTALQLNGVGTRNKFFMTIYAAALYLDHQEADASKILSTNTPISLSLEIVSGFVNKDKMSKAISEGFDNATHGNTAPIQNEIDQFLTQLQSGVEKKDRFKFSYIPDVGTIISKNGQEQTTIQGEAFRTAFFGIWLSDKPAQKSLKKALLGQ